MKIGIDARVLTYRTTGIANYTYNLIYYLSRVDDENEYIIFTNKPSDFSFGKSNFSTRVVRIEPFDFVKEQVCFTYEVFANFLDVFHSTFYVPPFVRICKVVFTIHDIYAERYPELYQSPRASVYFKRWRKLAARCSDKVIVVSNFIRNDAKDTFRLSDEKLAVIHEAAGENFVRVEDKELIANFRKKHSIFDDFIFTIGYTRPQKNIKNLIKAFAKLRKEMRIKEKLVICGEGYLSEDTEKLIDDLNLKDDIKFLGYIPDKEIPLLYSASSLFVFPTLMEGFGIPLVEAMACGVAVVASNVTSIPEVVKDAAVLFNPLDVNDMANVIYKVLSDGAVRGDLIEKGLKRAEEFSWEKMAKETLGIYNELFLC